MKPVLYKKNETEFRNYGLGEISDAYAVEVTRERNGSYTLYIKYPLDGAYASVFENEMLIKSDAGVRTKWQTFEINRVRRDSKEYIEVFARHISQRTEDIQLKPIVKGGNIDAYGALRIWQENLVGDDQFDVWSDISTLGSFTWEVGEVPSARAALGGVSGSILQNYGGEFEFDNRTIKLHRQLGRKAPTVLEYGRNIINIEEDTSLEEVYTSIYPYAKYTPEGEGAKEVLVTLPELIVDGRYLTNYSKRRIKQVDFSSHFENKVPDVEKIRELAKAYVLKNEIGKPKIEIEVNYVDLAQTLDYQDYQVMEEVELCDIIPLYYPSFGLTSTTEKVVEIVFDVYAEQNRSITLGTIGQPLASKMTAGVAERVDALEKKQADLEIALPKYLTNASGNRVWRETPDDDVEHKIGDVWFNKNGQYDRMYIWNGNMWEKILDTEDVDLVGKKVTQVENQIDTIAQSNQETAQKVQEALNKSGAVKELAAEAKRISDAANQSAAKALKDLLATGETLNDVKTEVKELDGAVKKRLTKVEVDELVKDKGYVAGTVFDNYKTETAQAIERKLTETRALIPTEVGGENLLKNSLFAKTSQAPERFTVAGVAYVNKNVESWSNFYNSGISNPTTSYHAYLNETFVVGTPVVEFNESNGTRNWKGISQKISPDKLISRDYHFSVDSYATGAGAKFWFGFYYFNKSGRRDFHAGTTTVIPTAVNQWQRLGGVIKLNDDVDTTKDILFYFYAFEFTSNAILYIKRPKLERGKIGTDHSLALEDMVTTVDFNRVRETAQLYERIIGTTEGDVATKISRMAMTSELFMTEVGKALSSSENLVYDPTRYSKYQPRNGTSKPILAGYTMYSAMRISHSGLTADQFNGFRLPLRTSTFTAGEKLSLRAVIGIDALPDSGGHIKFEIKRQGTIIAYFWLNPTRVGNNQVFTATTTVQVSTASVDEYGLDVLINRNGNVNITQISLVRGDTPPKSFVDNTSSQEVNLATKMTQMSDSWAVKTLNSRGDVLSQINLAAGATSIEVGKNKLVITPETTYFQNGTIKSAMIESLDAGKIRTGRLDANLVNIINLNANNITSGSISGNMISGGVLSSLNGQTFFDLQNGYFGVNSEGVAIDNQFPGRPRQYLEFGSGNINGVDGSYTALMSNRSNRIGFDSTSAGIQIWNGARGANIHTAITLYGRSLDFLAHGGGIEGISIDTRQRTMDGLNDLYIMGHSLKGILDDIFDNFRNLANNENYSRGYYPNWR